jgi:hypothetical protein
MILIGNDFNSNSELQITIRKKNDVVPCPKRGDVTYAQFSAPNYLSIICIRKQHSNHMEDDTFKRILQDKQSIYRSKQSRRK